MNTLDYDAIVVGSGISGGWAAKELTEKGLRTLVLEVRVSNFAAQALYRAHGFRLAGLRRGYYRDSGEDALIMEWRGKGVAQA